MFINENVVAIVFRLINFVALIAAAIFLFKKYFKNDLLSMMAEQKCSLQQLQEQQHIFEKEQADLDALLKEEAIQCKNFRAKIDEWKKVVMLQHESAHKAQTLYLIAAQERAQHIAVNRERTRINAIVADAVATNVEKSLSHYFSDSRTNTHYLNTIIDFMDERIS